MSTANVRLPENMYGAALQVKVLMLRVGAVLSGTMGLRLAILSQVLLGDAHFSDLHAVASIVLGSSWKNMPTLVHISA
jgi:hypothetical protein